MGRHEHIPDRTFLSANHTVREENCNTAVPSRTPRRSCRDACGKNVPSTVMENLKSAVPIDIKEVRTELKETEGIL